MSDGSATQGPPRKRLPSTPTMLPTSTLWRSDAPAIANTSPRQYSCFSAAISSAARYASGVTRGRAPEVTIARPA